MPREMDLSIEWAIKLNVMEVEREGYGYNDLYIRQLRVCSTDLGFETTS